MKEDCVPERETIEDLAQRIIRAGRISKAAEHGR